ncbi:DUF305 domain-containing protein [soil metagenome]
MRDLHQRRFSGFKIFYALLIVCTFASAAFSQSIVQPGAPGQPTRKLPADTRAVLPAKSAKDVEFMRGMIMHHAQAVEMTALIEERTKNKDVRLLGARISQSQLDEMDLMKRWLVARGESTEMKTSAAHGSHSHGSHHSPVAEMRMPGMLNSKQMADLKAARDAAFDKLFLLGMIQHHEGALAMVDDLFDTPGAGQDAEIFSFATDVDTGQIAEIRIMQTLLNEKP